MFSYAFSRCSRASKAKKYTKKRATSAELLLLFFKFSLRVKLPILLGPDGRDRSLSYKLMLKRKVLKRNEVHINRSCGKLCRD